MNKYLMMSVAALAATTATVIPSIASTATIVEHSTGGATYCDQIDLTYTAGSSVYADIHNWDPCGLSSESHGMGISGYTKGVTAGKKKEKPNNVALSDYYKADVSQGYDVDFQLGLPLKSGNAFNGYYTTNGTTVDEYIEGKYTLGGAGVDTRGKPSTIDALRAYLKENGK